MTASYWLFFLVLALSNTSCSVDETGIMYSQPLLKEKIAAYIQSPAGQADKAKVLTVVVAAHQDTVRVDLATTYPNANEIAVIGHDTLAHFHVFFVGEPMPTYYRVKDANPHAAEVALKNLIATRYGSHPIPGINYRISSYWFVNGQLVKEHNAAR